MDRSSPRPPGRPVSAQRYWVRRAVAVVVIAVVGYALVRAVSGVIGGDDTDTIAGAPVPADVSADADDAASPGAAATSDPAPTDSAGGSDTDTSTVATGAEGPSDADADESGTDDADDDADADGGDDGPSGPPTAQDPAKVYIVGDSDAGTFGPYLQQLLDGTLVADTELDYKVSSGLARPDFFDWPAQLREKLPQVDPDIVVVTFGGNDAQGLSAPQETLEFVIGDPVSNEAEWSAEYQRRAGEVMDLLLEDGRDVVWVGIPNDDNPEVTAGLAIQDRAAKAAAAERPDVVFVDTWTRFSGRDGGWAEFVVDPRDGQGKDVRADDGFHLNENGAEILAIDIAVEVREILRGRGAAV